MAPKKKVSKTSSAPKKATRSSGAGKAKATTEKAVVADSAAKVAAREEQTAQQMQQVVARVVNGDEKLAAVAKDLKITSGKAAFLIMQHRVATGDVAKITGKDDEALLKNINAARTKADEFSSWGWLAARSGRSEGFIKSGLEKAGLYKPGAENIASKRSNGKPTAAKKETGGSGKKKTVRGNA